VQVSRRHLGVETGEIGFISRDLAVIHDLILLPDGFLASSRLKIRN
jgi:hypothetical protein